MPRFRALALAFPLLVGGCAAGPDYERPELDVPGNYIQPVEQGVEPEGRSGPPKPVDVGRARGHDEQNGSIAGGFHPFPDHEFEPGGLLFKLHHRQGRLNFLLPCCWRHFAHFQAKRKIFT